MLSRPSPHRIFPGCLDPGIDPGGTQSGTQRISRREQVTREFTAMAQEGLVERTRGALVLKRPDVLQARIAEAMQADV